MVMEVVRHRVLHRRVPAPDPREGVTRRQRAAARPLLSAPVRRTQDPRQRPLGPQRAQIEGRPPRQPGGHLVIARLLLGVAVRVHHRGGGAVRLAHAGSFCFYRGGDGHGGGGGGRCAVLVAAGTATPVRDRGGAPVTPSHEEDGRLSIGALVVRFQRCACASGAFLKRGGYRDKEGHVFD